MRSAVLFAAFALTAFAAGCGSQASKPAAAPTEAALEGVDPSSDPSFVPPDESGVTMVEKPSAKRPLGEKAADRNEKARNLPSPNGHQGSRGSVHHAH